MTAVLDKDAGVEQRELGLWACALNNQDFVQKARSVARLICAVSGSVTIDAVRTHPAMQGLQPSSSHVFGAIFHAPGWVCIGMEPSQVRSNRARRILRWEWRP